MLSGEFDGVERKEFFQGLTWMITCAAASIAAAYTPSTMKVWAAKVALNRIRKRVQYGQLHENRSLMRLSGHFGFRTEGWEFGT